MLSKKTKTHQTSRLGTADRKNQILHSTIHRPYYKQYSSLRFDVIRSPQQIERWNRLTRSIISQEQQSRFIKPFIIKQPSARIPDPIILNKFNIYLRRLIIRLPELANAKLLPPLPPDFKDAILTSASYLNITMVIPVLSNSINITKRNTLSLWKMLHCYQTT
uniref:Uncharacterized protein n=1 Tax=Rhizophagus irregularis (strain DAOM 181602 / DAOM 197198 / MUCL 43194) TaxID=747089 RepID=U9UVA6_RHIID